MKTYLFIVAAVLVLGVFMEQRGNGNKKYIILMAALHTFVCGFRYMYLTGDLRKYAAGYYEIVKSGWLSENVLHEGRNTGFFLLMKVLSELTGGDFQIFLFFIALVTEITLAILIVRYSPLPWMSYLVWNCIGFYVFGFSSIKQALAMGVLMIAMDAILQEKPRKFLIATLLAGLIHFPALVFLPAYWVANMKLERGYLIFLSGLLILTYLFRDRLISFMTEAYYSSEMATTSQLRFLANKVIIILIIIVAALVIRPPQENDRLYRVLLHLMGIAAVIQTFAGYSNVFERLADYYFQFSVIFIPMVFEGVRTERRYLDTATTQLVCSFGPYIFGSFAIWRFLDTITSDGHFVPFRFFFQ